MQKFNIASLYFMAFSYIVAGILHFVMPEFYVKIIPPDLPWPMALVYISGVAEIALGIGLFIPQFRILSAWGVMALLIAVFPANVHHYTSGGVGMDVSQTWLFIRLPIQGLLLLWAYWHTKK